MVLHHQKSYSLLGSGNCNTKLGALPKGTVIQVGYCLNGWFGVIYNGKQGFISGDYVELV